MPMLKSAEKVSANTSEAIQKINLQIQIGHKVMKDQHGTKREQILNRKIILPMALAILGTVSFHSCALVKKSKIGSLFATLVPKSIELIGLLLVSYTLLKAYAKFKSIKAGNKSSDQAENLSFPDLGMLTVAAMLLYIPTKLGTIASSFQRVGLASILSSVYIFSQAKKTYIQYKETKLLEREAAKLVHANPQFFPKDGAGNITIYEDAIKGKILSLQKDNSFKYRKPITLDNHLKPYCGYPHPYRLPKELRFMHNKPAKKTPVDQFSHLDSIDNDSIEFSGNKVYMNSEILFLSDAKGSALDIAYSQVKKEILQRSGPAHASEEKEIISAMSSWIRDKMIQKIQPKYAQLMQRREHSVPPVVVDIADFFAEGAGVCRHQAPSLGFLLQKAKEDGFLSGTICLKQGNSQIKDESHILLIYFKPEEQNYLVVDPAQNVVQYISELNAEDKAFYDEFQLFQNRKTGLTL